MSINKSVFVTVGTTEFDSLVKSVVDKEFLKALSVNGYSKLVIQIGKGAFIPKEEVQQGVALEVFRYKDNIISDFQNADLVISHAGAGSCFEALELGKPLIAVINNSLMNNHQIELAKALSEERFCSWCYTDTLLPVFLQFDISNLTKYEPGQPKKLINYIDSVFVMKN